MSNPLSPLAMLAMSMQAQLGVSTGVGVPAGCRHQVGASVTAVEEPYRMHGRGRPCWQPGTLR